MNGTEFGLRDEELRDIIETPACTASVEAALVFGSRAKGNSRLGNDVDTLENEALREHIDQVGKVIFLRSPENVMSISIAV